MRETVHSSHRLSAGCDKKLRNTNFIHSLQPNTIFLSFSENSLTLTKNRIPHSRDARFNCTRITSLCEVAFRIFKVCHEKSQKYTKKEIIANAFNPICHFSGDGGPPPYTKRRRPPSPNSDQSAKPLPNTMLQEKSLQAPSKTMFGEHHIALFVTSCDFLWL